MALQRQSGTDRFSTRSRIDAAIAGEQIGARNLQKFGRIRRSKPSNHISAAAVAIGVTVLVGLYLSLLAFHRLSVYRENNVLGEKSKSEARPRLERTLAFKELKFSTGASTGRISGMSSRKDKAIKEDIADRVQGNGGIGRLYNEGGRKELDSYLKKYEDSLKKGVPTRIDGEMEQSNFFDEYDDGIDEQDEHEDIGDVSAVIEDRFGDSEVASTSFNSSSKASGEVSNEAKEFSSVLAKKLELKRKPKHHKPSRSSCEMKLLDSNALLVEPLENKKFSRFSIQYTEIEEMPHGTEEWEPRFAGHQSSRERELSYIAHDQKINCGFIKGPPGSPSTGFDLAEDDTKYMSSCHIAVTSCIFGNSDNLRTPYHKTISRHSRKNVCFIMFVDEVTLQTLLSEGQKMDASGFIGLWKIILIQNLPFSDMRRVGKIPKFLAHRLFPSARYSIWLDSKLRLQSDPYLILEYFLWRKGHEFAISNHYDRHCVWEEVTQNKKLNKYNHSVIDQQFEFYQSDGLKRFDPLDPNKLLPSYVPEGSFIVRAHTPMSNLFSCLWFNEVDRWTPRDQLSFGYTYLKLRKMNPEKKFYLNMFKDCERRSVAKLFHHRSEDRRNISTQ